MSNSGSRENDALFGVNLASETSTRDVSKDLHIGVIRVCRACTLTRLKHVLPGELPDLRDAFSFITVDGRNVTRTQEKEITVSELVGGSGNIIRILKCYDTPRVGVCKEDGTAIGFLHIKTSSSLQQLREELENQLGLSCKVNCTFSFLDRNCWPVRINQENQLCVLDLLTCNTCVTVCQHTAEKRVTCKCEADTVTREGKLRILISYVRKEALDFAVELKKKLTECDYSVFLDVHDIKGGSDWQDMLNDAVTRCEIFVPLVTEQYGKTEWTNRELKLADCLKKQILPVNFLDDWPPDSLAIQFATKHFIEGRPARDNISNSSIADGEMDSSFVQTNCVDNVVLQLKESISSKLTQKVNTFKSSVDNASIGYHSQSRDQTDQPLIVLSFHPDQRKTGKSLQGCLKENRFNVWCSCPSVFEDDVYGIDFSDSPIFENPDIQSPLSDSGHCFSQSSSQEVDLGCPVAKNKDFRENADKAALIIFILSEQFAKSKTSRQQVFYCQKRKTLLPVRDGDFCMPSWLSVLIGTNEFLDCKNGNHGDKLCQMVKKALDPSEKDNTTEKFIAESTKKLRSILPKQLGIYISGSTSLYSKLSKPICVAIGKQLAGMMDIHVGTGGFYGIGECVGHSFHEERRRVAEDTPPSLWHVLPCTKQGSNKQARQNRDGSFKKLEYGRTVYSGSSVRQRETIVAKAFDVCILIEGGPRAAHEAQEFMWNEHVVIPIKCTGGAAGGKFDVPKEIFKVPPGVSEHDWDALSEKNPLPDQLAQSVVSIIEGVRKRLDQDISVEKESAYLSKSHGQTLATNGPPEELVTNNIDALSSKTRPNKLVLTLNGHGDVSRSPSKRKASITRKSPKSPKVFKGKK